MSTIGKIFLKLFKKLNTYCILGSLQQNGQQTKFFQEFYYLTFTIL